MQDIAQHGGWNYDAMTKNYIQDFSTPALLGLGGWKGAAHRDFRQFFAERMCITVPKEFVQIRVPLSARAERGTIPNHNMRPIADRPQTCAKFEEYSPHHLSSEPGSIPPPNDRSCST